MADINVNINGVDTVLTDDGDSTFSIDLQTPQARQFLRAERDELKARKTFLQDERDVATLHRDRAIARRDSFAAERQAAVDEIGVVTARIDEIKAFLSTVGDDPDA